MTMTLPLMVPITQRFPDDNVGDVAAAVHSAIETLNPPNLSGQRIAITAGSRGIASIVDVLRTVVKYVRQRGGEPFIIPAMGSHGGGTAEGQTAVLEKYGITEKGVDAPILASMDTVIVGQTRWGSPVHKDRLAHEADGIVIVGRVKEHTNYDGRHESGLVKMLAVGLGKKNGADCFHDLAMNHGYEAALLETAAQMIGASRVVFGLGLVENAYGHIARIEACTQDQLFATDARLLEYSRTIKPKLPVEELDLLIVDEIGKDISGTGMDTKVVGRIYHFGQPEPKKPRIKRIFVRDLTKATAGNATGIGLADFTTRRLAESIDRESTYVNCLTANHPEVAKLPVIFDTDREAIETAIATCGLGDPAQARVIRIRNTLDMLQMQVSESLAEALSKCEGIQVHGSPTEMLFDGMGNLVSQ